MALRDSTNIPKFKFMTNILSSNASRNIKLKWLENICPDGEIPFSRLIITMLGFGALIVALLSTSLKNVYKFSFVWQGVMFLVIAMLIFAYQSLASIRGNKALIFAIFSMEKHHLEEFVRRKMRDNNLVLKNLGINSMKNGILRFTDDYVGVAYLVGGQLNNSVLPSVVLKGLVARENYLISRKSTSNEFLITSVQSVDIKAQLSSLDELYDKNDGEDLDDMWNRFMIYQMREHVKRNFENKDTSIKQVLIIKDVDIRSLKQSQEIFERAVNNEGLYANAMWLNSKESLCKYLSSIALLSKKGVDNFVKEEKKGTR